jgi:3',5'-cyclic AMP phosphodiesterase CpdA
MARLVYLRIRRRLRPGTYARVERSPATATRAAFVVAAVAFTTSVLAQTGCASIHFQGAGQIPVLAPVETAARHPVGPWLTPLFGPEPAMIASWITAYPIESRLFVGTDPDSLEIQSGEVRAKLHRAILAGLEPGRRYWYAPDFGDGGHPGDRLYTFVAPDWSGHSAEILLLGDMQPRDAVSRRGGRLMARAVADAAPDLVIQLGDLAEIGAFPSHWLATLSILSTFASGSPTVGVIGNHDYYGDPGRNFRRLFPYPYPPGGSYWSFDVAGAHFAMVDCFENAGKVSDCQKAWLEDDLAAAAARGARYLFVVLHQTPLTTGTSRLRALGTGLRE